MGVAIGTANLHNRSFRLNFQVSALVMEPAFAISVKTVFKSDFARSRLSPSSAGGGFYRFFSFACGAMTSIERPQARRDR